MIAFVWRILLGVLFLAGLTGYTSGTGAFARIGGGAALIFALNMLFEPARRAPSQGDDTK